MTYRKKQLKDTEKRDKFRIYGELINTYGYGITPAGAKQFNALNYYTNEEITIPLDETLTPIENANKYFAKYNKLKRTYEAGTRLIAEIKDEIMYLESIINAIDIATTENDLNNIKDELAVTGYIKKEVESQKAKEIHTTNLCIMYPQMALTYMLEKIISRMMNSPSNSPLVVTGGFMQSRCQVPML